MCFWHIVRRDRGVHFPQLVLSVPTPSAGGGGGGGGAEVPLPVPSTTGSHHLSGLGGGRGGRGLNSLTWYYRFPSFGSGTRIAVLFSIETYWPILQEKGLPISPDSCHLGYPASHSGYPASHAGYPASHSLFFPAIFTPGVPTPVSH